MLTRTSTQADVLRTYAPFARTYLEVGVQEGRSLQLVCEANPSIKSVALCDTWGSVSGGTGRGSHAHIEALLAALPEAPPVTFLDGDSRETLPLVTGQFDLVHIDGGHSYEVALSDLTHGWRLCRDVLVVHDISFAEVWRACCEFFAGLQGAHELELYFGGHGTAVVRRCC